MNKDFLVTKSNILVTSSYDLTLQEQKLILTLASMVQPQDIEFKEYNFKIKDFMELLEVKDKSKYVEIPKITKELMKKVFEIRDGKNIIQLSWLCSAIYKTGEGAVALKFTPDLKPYMLQLKELYTSYKLENILSLKSKYSLRLYELLKCNQFKGKWEIELEELKRLLSVKEKSYSVYQNVKNRIIIQAKIELEEKTDIKFEFEEIKTGRKVTSIKFIIYKNNYKLKKEDNKSLDEVSVTLVDNAKDDNIKIIIDMMKDHNIGHKEALSIYNSAKGDIEHIEKVYDHFKDKESDNFVGLMVSMVKPGKFNEPNPSNKKLKFDNFKGREYDYDDLEKKLLGWDKE